MYVDAFTISALVDELMDTVVGGRIQDSVMVDSTGIGLEIYANRQRQYLYISADKHAPRVHLVPEKLRRGMPKPSQLALLVRRYVEGGIVTHVSQPPWERILHIDVEGAEGEVLIIVEPMERRSNTYLVQDGMILDVARRVGSDDNRYRLSLPAHEYEPPPPLTGRLDPYKLSLEGLQGIFDQNEDDKNKTVRLLTSRLLGFSPLIAKEVVHRSGAPLNQKAPDADPSALHQALGELMQPLSARQWEPGIVEADGEVQAFSVYPITHMDGWHSVETLSDAMTAYFGMPSGPDGYKIAKKPVQEALEEAQAKLGAKLRSLKSSLKETEELEEMRKKGELLLAYQYTIEDGQTAFHAQYDPGEPELEIRLDPDLSPLENAQNFFKKYEKAKKAYDDVPRLVKETQNQLDYITQLETDLDLAGNWPEIDEVRQTLKEMGHWQGNAPRKIGGGQSGPLRLVTRDGFVMWVGRNSRQNDIATFGKGSGSDLWLHARDVPGAHVIIKNDGRPIPEEVIEQAASIAAYYSKLRSEGSVIVDVTERKYVKKIKGAAPGMVTYRNEETRTVRPRPEHDFEKP